LEYLHDVRELEVVCLKILFLYSEDCPSYTEALVRLRKVLGEEGVRAEISIKLVETDEQAAELHFLGSPTIVIDGRDIDPQPTPRYALMCRAYRLEDGRISPLPSARMMRSAVRAAKERQAD
jgi:hypothetical protein